MTGLQMIALLLVGSISTYLAVAVLNLDVRRPDVGSTAALLVSMALAIGAVATVDHGYSLTKELACTVQRSR